MRSKFQADADLDGRIVRGLKRKSRDVDIRTAATAGFAGLRDPEVLRLSAEALIRHQQVVDGGRNG